MEKSEIPGLFEYNQWADGRVLEVAGRTTAAQFTAPERVSHGSLRGTLIHMLTAEWIWRQRCQEGYSPGDLDFITYLRQKRD